MKMQTWTDSATGPKQELENCTKIIHLNNQKYSEIKQRERLRFYNNKSLALFSTPPGLDLSNVTNLSLTECSKESKVDLL